jgi:DNA-binding NtrC family response regulator
MMPEENSKSASLPGGKEKILVVDDDETIILLEKIMLEKLGYEVTVYANSIDALMLFENEPEYFDMLITDQAMPRLTGEELIKKVISRRPGMPIILNSGYSAEFTREKAISMGVSEFIQKPLNMEQLAQAVRRSFAKADS